VGLFGIIKSGGILVFAIMAAKYDFGFEVHPSGIFTAFGRRVAVDEREGGGGGNGDGGGDVYGGGIDAVGLQTKTIFINHGGDSDNIQCSIFNIQ
jgi:hypothetical protein